MSSLSLWRTPSTEGQPSRTSTIRARVPLRLGLAGGGTDLSPYCDTFGGAVLNTTIDRYAYAFIAPSEDGNMHFIAPDMGMSESYEIEKLDENTAQHGKLRIHAGVALGVTRRFGLPIEALRLTSFVDAPPGSGLGSSSALVVALVEAFAAHYQLPLGPYDVAHLAWQIERVDLDLLGGKQDQYAGTFGGTNFIEFLANDRVIVNPLRVPESIRNEIETSLVIAFSGVSRSSATIIAEQRNGLVAFSDAAIENMHRLKHDAHEMKDALLRGDIVQMASILNRSWVTKKNTAQGISTSLIETLYSVAHTAGALGGKVSGAGGGGFMMLIVPPERRVEVIQALNKAGATASGVHLVTEGAATWKS